LSADSDEITTGNAEARGGGFCESFGQQKTRGLVAYPADRTIADAKRLKLGIVAAVASRDMAEQCHRNTSLALDEPGRRTKS
jgi:hypothetical protein